MIELQSRLSVYRALTPSEEAALAALTVSRRTFAKGEDIALGEGVHPDVHLVLDGVVQEEKDFNDGVRQILSFYMAGDLVGLNCLFTAMPPPSRSAAAPSTVLQIDGPELVRLISTEPALAVLFWRDAARTTAITREWMVSMGRRTALSRTAHFMCEVFVRMAAGDNVKAGGCAFTLTQSELADALGLSVVHVNRVLQKLRSEGLISLGGGRLVMRDWLRLTAVAAFDPGYLEPVGLPSRHRLELEEQRT